MSACIRRARPDLPSKTAFLPERCRHPGYRPRHRTIEDRVRYLAQDIPRGPPEPIGPILHAPAHGFEYLEAFIEAHRNDQALTQEHADPANLQGLRAGPIASTREPDAQRVAEGLDAGSTWALDRLLYSRPLYLKSAGERVEFFLMRLVQDDTREVVGSLTGL